MVGEKKVERAESERDECATAVRGTSDVRIERNGRERCFERLIVTVIDRNGNASSLFAICRLPNPLADLAVLSNCPCLWLSSRLVHAIICTHN